MRGLNLAKGTGMRRLALLFLSSVAGLSACSFLLDTEDLKKGPAASATDAGATEAGTGQPTDAASTADADAGACTTDFDCLPTNFNGCQRIKCKNGTCGMPEKYSGVGVSPEGAIQTSVQADDIGYPSLLADGSNFYLAVWKRDGTMTTNIEVHRIPENPALGGQRTDLASLLPNAYEQYGSSPGMAVVGLLGGRLRLLFAADPTGVAAPMGMHLLDVDETTLQPPAKAEQPKVDPAVVGFDTNPRGPAPRLINGDWGLWVQSEKLFFFDGQNPGTAAYAARRVLDFAPMIGVGGPYAALATAPTGMQAGNQSTGMWANGNATLATLVGDDTGERRGVSVAWYPESVANIIVWSYVSQALPTLKTNIAGCIGTFCQSAGDLQSLQNNNNTPASFPQIASGKVPNTDKNRDFAETFQVSLAVPNDPSRAVTVLVGSMIRVVAGAGDAGADAGSPPPIPFNPPDFPIASLEGPAVAAAGEVLGPSSIAMTNDGHVLVAWVERAMAGTSHVLKTRRFAVQMCP
jgi:hypothetical protein